MGSTKEDIMAVALHLFAQNGYEAVSVSQIAGALGMTKGALYRHYENKRDIFLHIVRRMELWFHYKEVWQSVILTRKRRRQWGIIHRQNMTAVDM